MLSDNTLITFKAISNFVSCLSEVFGKEHRSLKLYAHLINKTTLTNIQPIEKHVNAFKDFCITNRDAIIDKKYTEIELDKIVYSTRVFIDIKSILKQSDKETSTIIWKHLLTISALVDPTGKAKQVLQETSNKGVCGKEADFLQNIIGKVEEHVDPNSNPMEAVSAIMKSGIFSELVGGMGSGLEDGTLDLSKLMGTVQTMVTTLNEKSGDSNEGANDAVNMLSTMVGSMSAGANSDGSQPQVPDLANVMGMMGPMLGALGNNSGNPNMEGDDKVNPIEAKINAQLAAAKKSGTINVNSKED